MTEAERLYFYDRKLRKKFGITLADAKQMLSEQGGCAICGRLVTFCLPTRGARGNACIDHDHQSGVIRGILCHACNTGVGLFEDDPDRLGKAVAYLLGKTR